MRGYRLVVRRAKRRYSRAREAQLMDLLKHKPKLFWPAVKHSPAAACTIGMQKYFEYFRALRQPPLHTQPSAAPVYNYVPAFKAHATDLDAKFTIRDIEQALVTVKSGKAADSYGDVAELFT